MANNNDLGINEHTRPEEAVRLAMERETNARAFYLQCMEIANDPGVKKLFEFLAREEQRHFELLEREYNRFIEAEN